MVQDPPGWLKTFLLSLPDTLVPEPTGALNLPQEPSVQASTDTSPRTTAFVVSGLSESPAADSKGLPLLKPEEPGIYPSLLGLETNLA